MLSRIVRPGPGPGQNLKNSEIWDKKIGSNLQSAT